MCRDIPDCDSSKLSFCCRLLNTSPQSISSVFQNISTLILKEIRYYNLSQAAFGFPFPICSSLSMFIPVLL